MKSFTLVLSSIPLVLSCAATPDVPPEELATTLVTELDAGRTKEARELFARVGDDAEYREKVYPVLYGTARTRYQDGNALGAAALLRFLHKGYPDAVSVREALLYALFLERAGQETPDPALGAEIEGLLAELRAQSSAPVWVDLIAAQQGIDRGDTQVAREAYARFLEAWDHHPGDAHLALYVDDIGRHLAGQDDGR